MDKPPPPYSPPTAPYPTQDPCPYPLYPQINQPTSNVFMGSGYQPAPPGKHYYLLICLFVVTVLEYPDIIVSFVDWWML
ncbi:unnamed protein product [Schistosoma curassoni]|nr:unnamed protein product [Schistosoma curassoni]